MATQPKDTTRRYAIVAGKKLALRPATKDEARRITANVLQKNLGALKNLKDR